MTERGMFVTYIFSVQVGIALLAICLYLGLNQRVSIESNTENRIQSREIEEVATTAVSIRDVAQLNDRISMLEKINFDKLGPTDYAARIFGGEVISVASHFSSENGSLLAKLQNIFQKPSYNQMQCIVQDCSTCLSVAGSHGSIYLKLSADIVLHSLTIEHFPLHAYPKSKHGTYSAIKEFSVWGTNDLNGPDPEIWYGSFWFDYKQDFLQTFHFAADTQTQTVRYVRVEFFSNHGEDYTCIYRLRVHGFLL
ncbi:sperm-associated antigen 4 protein [Anopheles bellator]|uniref:sperm-associated antigen 4 protein n=1 Tax=Anopheles bellator TaxID=139047 RepID=UPI002648624F|nr:sperm-associated antigen 4 protein [Anopheles bellator]